MDLVDRLLRLWAEPPPEADGMEVLDRVDAPGRVAIDILTIADDLVTEIWVVGDELGRLLQLGAIALAQPPQGSLGPGRS